MEKRLKTVFAAICTVAVLGAMLWFGWGMLQKQYLFWNFSLFPRDVQTLDIRGKQMRNPESFLELTELQSLDARNTGMTVDQYEWFCQAMPKCRVLWDVPIQGGFYPVDTQELTVKLLTEKEIDALKYLPQLTRIDAPDWQDYEAIQTLQTTYPNCTVYYRIAIGGDVWEKDSVSVLVSDANVQELTEKLGLFSNLESVMLTGNVPDLPALQELQDQYPEIFFLWKMEAFGRTLETDSSYLDLSGAGLKNTRELENLLPYLPQLKTVRLDDSGLEESDCIALAKQFPDIQFVFSVTVGDYILRTDVTEIDISDTPMESTEQIESLLPCFRDLEKVVMCRCGISSEDMDALNQRYADIRFVWSVELAEREFRTDDVHFTPNRWGLKCTDENIYDLRYCTDMVCVDVGHAFRLTNCDWAAFMPNLKYLILAETGISDLTPLTGHENLIFLELFLSKVTDYSPLTTCKALEDLNLCYTQGDYKPIAEMTWLKRLWWSGSWKARTTLPDLMPDSVYMEFLSTSSTGRGWREGQHYYDMRDFIGMDYMVG